MRIVGGFLKGRRFNPPAKNWPTRPTTDYSKEGLYNILMNKIDFEEIVFLDLFGGTGSHCYEMISRGCEDATYVDKFPAAVRFVQETSKQFGIDEYLQIVREDVFKFIKKTTRHYDLIFAGPPYPLKNIADIPDIVISSGILKSDGMLILEHNPNVNLDDHPHLIDQRSYGQTIFSFFKQGHDKLSQA